MSVYFLESNGLIKIGYSTDVRRRVDQVIRTQRCGGKYLGFMPGDRKVEKHLHAVFADHREFGEWFRSSEEIMAFISSACSADYPDECAAGASASDRLKQLDEFYAEQAGDLIRLYTNGSKNRQLLSMLAETIGVATHRIEEVYAGDATSVTAGEMMSFLQIPKALGLDDADTIQAGFTAREMRAGASAW